jgi:rhodanese-related sulfurtransferase
MEKLSPRELSAWLADPARPAPLLIDVREDWEVALCRLDGARHIPMATVPAAAASLPDDVPLVIYCHHGVRSMQVAIFLERQGYTPVYNLQGGIDAWAYDVAPDMNHY